MENYLIERGASPAPLHELLGLTCRVKVVDVGANPIDGPSPYAPLLKIGRADVVGFEPNPEALAKLNSQKGPHETYLPHVVADGRRQRLRICALPGMTSLLEPNPAVLSLFHGFSEWSQVVQVKELQTVRLDDVPETAGLDMLKIDIQGGELMVFEHATERLKDALVIHTEVEFLEMYLGQPLFADIDRFLRARGFVIHKFDPLVGRDFQPLLMSLDRYVGHSQLFWADAVFVRDFTRLERLDADQLLRLVVILHDCYRSHDLVLFLLREYDRRVGASYGDAFLRAVTAKSG
jgi:FkbM family methyltransferase